MSELIDSPLWSVRSGPSLAPVAARTVAAAETGSGDVIVCDTGGTSFDVSLVRERRSRVHERDLAGRALRGHLTGLSSVDVRSIGAGGGSIAWVDPGGLLRVGPESAGADPGPACYGRGGTRADGHRRSARARLRRPRRASSAARWSSTRPRPRRRSASWPTRSGSLPEQAAHAVLPVANERMIAAIHELTVNEGVDPREARSWPAAARRA